MKQRNSIRCTYELLRDALKLQGGIEILNVVNDPSTESIQIIFTSEDAVLVPEGNTIPAVDHLSITEEYVDGCICPCGGKLLPSGANGIAEDESPEKIINVANYVYCDTCGQDYVYKTVLEEIDLNLVIKESEEE